MRIQARAEIKRKFEEAKREVSTKILVRRRSCRKSQREAKAMVEIAGRIEVAAAVTAERKSAFGKILLKNSTLSTR